MDREGGKELNEFIVLAIFFSINLLIGCIVFRNPKCPRCSKRMDSKRGSYYITHWCSECNYKETFETRNLL